MKRIAVLALLCGVAIAIAAAGCTRQPKPTAQVIVLGFDGMDHALTADLMARGLMPNFSRLAASGGFAPLGTAIPPQSPVAWSTFITGLGAGGHGIFDFIHREPATTAPFLSTSRARPPRRMLPMGRYQFPLSPGTIELLREGQPFWDVLEEHGVRSTIVRMPANFPPSGRATRELSGMGTPDLLGGYGTYSFYTSEPFAFKNRPLTGQLHRIDVVDNVVRAQILGPANPFLREPRRVAAELSVYVDGVSPAARIHVGDEQRVLRVGEWSDWIPVAFETMPTQALRGMCRMYLKQVRPYFELYVSPINLDPFDPALPISTPGSFAGDLAHATGRFYTQGMPEDTKALEDGVLTRGEFLAQTRLSGGEVRRQLAHALDTFEGGLLFYYFGNLDQVSHMLWRTMDPSHPGYDPVADPPYRNVIPELYAELDAVVGDVLNRVSADTLVVVMSDHGFTSWRRSFSLNAWLRDRGYLAADPSRAGDRDFSNVDWTKTRAYGLGLNGLYLNLQGREPRGTVAPADRARLLKEISAHLLKTTDPGTGSRAVSKVYDVRELFPGAERMKLAPDLIVGYAKGVRCSNESALGGVAREVFTDNRSMWSGDHCMDHETVPGVLLTNRRLRKPAASIERLAEALLAELGIDWQPARQE